MDGAIPKIPSDLPSLMKDLTKLILRDKPGNIYEYAAEYFESKIRERDGHLNKNYERFSGSKVRRQQSAPEVLEIRVKTPKSRHSSGKRRVKRETSIDRSIPLSLPCKYNEPRPPSKKEPKRIAEKTNFNNVDEEDENGRWLLGMAAVRIQRAYRRHRERRERHHLDSGFSDENISKQQDTDTQIEDDSLLIVEPSIKMVRSAILIQKLIRGYAARKQLRQLKLEMAQSQQLPDDEQVVEFNNDELEKAAVTVQKTYRGFQVHKEVKDTFGAVNAEEEVKPVYEKEAEESLVELYRLIDAAVRIQKVYRGFKARKQYGSEIEILRKLNAENQKLELVNGDKKCELKNTENVQDKESLPDFEQMNAAERNEFEKAASTIQNVYKGFKLKKDTKENEIEKTASTIQDKGADVKVNQNDDLPDFAQMSKSELNKFEKAASTIQNVYKGFKVKKDHIAVEKDLPDFSKMNKTELNEFEKAASTIQNVYKGFKGTKDKVTDDAAKVSDDLPDFTKMSKMELNEFEKAASTIQNVYKGFKVKKEITVADTVSIIENQEDLPDFSKMSKSELSEFEKAASTIQNVYKGFKVKKDETSGGENQEDLPDFTKMSKSELNEFEKAASTIQNVYKGFKVKKENDEQIEENKEDLPDFTKMSKTELNEFEKAASTIQSVYKGFKVKKEGTGKPENEETTVDDLPDFTKMSKTELNEFEKAASTIQNMYKGFRDKKDTITAKEDQEDLPDFASMSKTELNEFEKAASTIQNVYKGFKVKKDAREEINKQEAEDLPDFTKMSKLELREFEKAASAIQNVYKGFKVRKDKTVKESVEIALADDLPDFTKMNKSELNEFEQAASTIQNVYKGFKKKKDETVKEVDQAQLDKDDLPDFTKMSKTELTEFEKAASTIQNVYKGFKVKQKKSMEKDSNETVKEDELPDFKKMNKTELGELEKAASTIQNVYKGFKVKKDATMKEFEQLDETVIAEKAASTIENIQKESVSEELTKDDEELLDFSKMNKTELSEFEKAASTIQNVYKGFKVKKTESDMTTTKKLKEEELPDFTKMTERERNKFEKAANTIQTVYKGFKVKKDEKKLENNERTETAIDLNVIQEDLPDLPDFSKMDKTELGEFEKAASTIQTVYKGFKVKKEETSKDEELPDFAKMSKTELNEFEKAASTIQTVYKGFKVKDAETLQTKNDQKKVAEVGEGNEKALSDVSKTDASEKDETDKDEDLPDFASMGTAELNEFEKAASTIQNVYKGFKGKKAERKLKNEEKTEEGDDLPDFGKMHKAELNEFEKAASTIQTVYKGFKGKKEKSKLENEENPETVNEDADLPDFAKMNKTELNEFEKAASTIQTVYKGFKVKKEETKEQNDIKSATLIQRIYRGYIVRRDLGLIRSILDKKQLNDEFDPNDPKLQQAATSIQRMFRGHQAKTQSNLDRIDEESGPSPSKLKPTVSDHEVSQTLIAALEEVHEENTIEGKVTQAPETSNQAVTKEESVDSGMNEDSESKGRSAHTSDDEKPTPSAPIDEETGETIYDKLKDEPDVDEVIKSILLVPEILKIEIDTPIDFSRKQSEDSICTESLVEPSREGDDKISIDSLMVERTLKDDSDDSLEQIPDYQDSDKSNSEATVKELEVDNSKPVVTEEPETSVAELIQGSSDDTNERNRFTREAFSTDRKAFSNLRRFSDPKSKENTKPSEARKRSGSSKKRSTTEIKQKDEPETLTRNATKDSSNSDSQDSSPASAGKRQFQYKPLNSEQDDDDDSSVKTSDIDSVIEVPIESTRLHRQITIEEPPCTKKEVSQTYPEIADEVSEIVSFDTSTHDKSTVEEEYYKLKKKEIEGIDPKIITAIKKQHSEEDGERSATTDSDDVVVGRISSAADVLDRTQILKTTKSLYQTYSTDDEVVLGIMDELDREKETKVLNKTFVIDGPGTSSETMNKTYVIETVDKSEETLDELKNLSDVPRRRLIPSMSVMQPDEIPAYEASIYAKHYMEHIQGNASDTNDTAYGTDHDIEDEDHFDDFSPGNIRQKIMASSFSVADSDYFDPHKPVATNDDSHIVTALETITSTESDATTTVSADTRVPLTGHEKMSFGDTAINESLEEFAMQTELPSITDLDENVPKTIQIKLETRPSSESSGSSASGGNGRERRHMNFERHDTASRRLWLQREDAVQSNSTPEDELSAKSNDEGEQVEKKEETVVVKEEKRSSRIARQRTLPVQIDTSIMRILPRSVVKRIKSADNPKRKLFTKPPNKPSGNK